MKRLAVLDAPRPLSSRLGLAGSTGARASAAGARREPAAADARAATPQVPLALRRGWYGWGWYGFLC